MSTELKSPMAVYTEQLEKLKGRRDPTAYAAGKWPYRTRSVRSTVQQPRRPCYWSCCWD